MTVETKHPTLTAARLADWALCRASYEGEGDIKAGGITYLPRPTGYTSGADGDALYESYKNRAQFPEIMAPSVGAMVGIIHGKEITVELPESMAYLAENIDGDSTTLVDFHKEITRQLLITGRFGILADAPLGGGDPYLASYTAETVINWDRDFFVLDECGLVRDGFDWVKQKQHRVLSIMDGVYAAQTYTDGSDAQDMTPTAQGGGALPRIPFAIASAKDMGPEVEAAPLVGIARSAKAIYQLSADYRLQLFMSGQETWVSFNCDAPDAVGAGVAISVTGTEGFPADAKYVSPTCSGIEAHLSAMQDNRMVAVQAGARLIEQEQAGNESGKARTLRFRSETANLMTIAQASCSLLEQSLRNIAMLLNQSDAVQQAIVVTPPKDLLDAAMTPQDAQAYWQLVLEGGLAEETYYERIQAGGIASEERTFEDEQKLIADAQDRAEGLTVGSADQD